MVTPAPRQAASRQYQPAPRNPFVEFAAGEIEQTLHGRFERVADDCSARTAVATRSQRLTYGELNARANRIANAIVASLGAAPQPVALLFQQGVAAIAATLGTIKAGHFYVPLETQGPAGDIARVLEESQARLLLTDAHHLARARELCGERLALLDVDQIASYVPAHNPAHTGTPESLAYVYYTSGSTGTPKGVMDTHRNVLHNVMRYTNRLHICADDRLTLLQPFAFSGVVSSLYCALLNGACVYPVDVRAETPTAIAAWLAEAGITIYHSVPALFRALLASGTAFPTVRLIRLEGDQASRADVELYRRHFAPECLLVNGLGTTETGIACQYVVDHATMLADGPLPIGYPNDGMEIRIVDGDGDPVADGEIGEIAVVSRHLSPGYWRSPVLTRQVFSPDRRDGQARVYRTRDLGRMQPDGCVEYLGRSDGRVKIRGQWVTLTDVETALLRCDEIREAVVDARTEDAGDTRLIAYCVTRDAAPLHLGEMRRGLADALPGYAIPTDFVVLERLPLSRNGKVDRRALTPPRRVRRDLPQPCESPQSLLQMRIAQVWEDVLGVQPVGIRDRFLELGGHSLQAARMVDRLQEVFGRRIPLSVLLEAADVETLADVLLRHNDDLRFPFLRIQPSGAKPPLFFLHGDYLSGGFYCWELARQLGSDQPLYAMPPFGLDDQPIPPSYEEMAARHIATLREFQAHGPYRLGGTCNGGMVAFEMARQLVDAGEPVERVLLIGSSADNVRCRGLQRIIAAAAAMVPLSRGVQSDLFERLRPLALELSRRSPRKAVASLMRALRKTPGRLADLLLPLAPRSDAGAYGGGRDGDAETPLQRRERLRELYQRIDRHYVPGPYANPVELFWPADDPESPENAVRWWQRVVPRVDLYVVRGTHLASLTQDVAELAAHVKRSLD